MKRSPTSVSVLRAVAFLSFLSVLMLCGNSLLASSSASLSPHASCFSTEAWNRQMHYQADMLHRYLTTIHAMRGESSIPTLSGKKEGWRAAAGLLSIPSYGLHHEETLKTLRRIHYESSAWGLLIQSSNRCAGYVRTLSSDFALFCLVNNPVYRTCFSNTPSRTIAYGTSNLKDEFQELYRTHRAYSNENTAAYENSLAYASTRLYLIVGKEKKPEYNPSDLYSYAFITNKYGQKLTTSKEYSFSSYRRWISSWQTALNCTWGVAFAKTSLFHSLYKQVREKRPSFLFPQQDGVAIQNIQP